MAYKSLQEYCDELIAKGDSWGQQLLDEFGNGDGIYENEFGMWQAPSDYNSGSDKKISWTCEKGHAWEASIRDRIRYRTHCSYCKGTKKTIRGKNDLASQYPELLKEWDYEINKDINPENVRYGSNKKVGWKCEKGHKWITEISSRTSGRGCPYCNGNNTILQGENDLASQFPEISKEWDYEYNGDLKPEHVRMKSTKKVGWKCEKGHKWEASIAYRTSNNSGCPYCSNKSTSYPEQFIYWGFKAIYPKTQNRVKLFKSEENPRGFEYDIYVPDLNLLIEYSGDKWHEGKEEYDNLKKELALSNGYKFINVLEIRRKGIIDTYEKEKIVIGNNRVAINKVLEFILNQFNHSVDELDLKEIELIAREYSKGKVEYEKSLQYLHPELIKEWDFENNSIEPTEVTYGSTYKAAWVCEKNHRWKACIADRASKKSGCPECYKLKMKARSAVPYLPTL